jgi:ribosomal protein S27E
MNGKDLWCLMGQCRESRAALQYFLDVECAVCRESRTLFSHSQEVVLAVVRAVEKS